MSDLSFVMEWSLYHLVMRGCVCQAPDHVDCGGKRTISLVGQDQKHTALEAAGAMLSSANLPVEDTNPERVTAYQYDGFCPST